MDTCGQCHARRGELTGDFVRGRVLGSLSGLTIADAADTYYPDGQVRDENYEFSSFLSIPGCTARVCVVRIVMTCTA